MNITIKDNTKLANQILRIGLGLTIIWFGLTQLMNPQDWIGFLPEWAFTQTIISTIGLVYINGIFETVTALMLIFNQHTKIASILLSIHMIFIIFHLGYNDLAVRDFGILVGLFALIFISENKCFIKKLNFKK
jgi:uncharacterized membrane protein YphA (DoxX/SURF4 family)